MWPWKRDGKQTDEIRTLTHRIEDLERQFRGLNTEWLDMYDKLARRDDRIRKREERQSAGDPLPMTPQDVKAALRARLAAGRASNGVR